MSDLELGASQERRRILKIMFDSAATHRLMGNERIARSLEILAAEISHNHRQDNEQ